jgi:hypothetical protein
VPGQGWNRTLEGGTPPRCSSKSATVRKLEADTVSLTVAGVLVVAVVMTAPQGERI